MRLLMCSSEAPLPPLGGLRQPLRQTLLRLADRHEITLLAYVWPDQEPAPVEGVSTTYIPVPASPAYVRALRFARATVAGKPLRAVELHPAMSAAVAEHVSISDFDAVHLTGLPLASLGPAVSALPSAMVTLDAWHLNAAAEVAASRPLLRPLKWLESNNTKRFERTVLRDFDRVVTVTDDDARALTDLDPAIASVVIPNGVDVDHFVPDRTDRRRHDIVFVGTMSWTPNIQAALYAARDVLPLVRRSFPDAQLSVVGRGATSATVRELEAHPGVSVVGEVPNVRPWLQRAHAGICPMVSGTGIKNKLLEALACGTPSVATPLACQGTGLVDERHLLLGTDPEQLADRVIRIFTDDELADRLAEQGRSYVVGSHSWGAVASRFEALYEEIAAERRGV